MLTQGCSLSKATPKLWDVFEKIFLYSTGPFYCKLTCLIDFYMSFIFINWPIVYLIPTSHVVRTHWSEKGSGFWDGNPGCVSLPWWKGVEMHLHGSGLEQVHSFLHDEVALHSSQKATGAASCDSVIVTLTGILLGSQIIPEIYIIVLSCLIIWHVYTYT